jgi:hypothetical protein
MWALQGCLSNTLCNPRRTELLAEPLAELLAEPLTEPLTERSV